MFTEKPLSVKPVNNFNNFRNTKKASPVARSRWLYSLSVWFVGERKFASYDIVLYTEKNGFVTATKLGTTTKVFVAATKNFAAATKRFVDRIKHFVTVTKYFC